MTVLIDTNILVALAFPRDINHVEARAAMRVLSEERVISAPVLPELFYLLTTKMSYSRAISAFEMAQTAAFRIEPLTKVDMQRMTEIMNTYKDNAFDFADAAIMAQSERLNITRVYTLDHRDFTVFRPSHCTHLTLLP